MKAEERKELETNTLADKMGKVVQTVKAGPNKSAIFWVILVAIAALGVFLYMRNRDRQRNEQAKGWFYLGLARNTSSGGRAQLLGETQRVAKGPAKDAAAISAAWLMLYNDSALMARELSRQPLELFLKLAAHGRQFEDIREKMKDQPLMAAEALYHLASVTEARSMLDHIKGIKLADATWEEIDPGKQKGALLDAAKERYEELATKYKDTPFGEMAQKRFDLLNDPAGFQQVADTYEEYARQFDLADRLITNDITRSIIRKTQSGKNAP